MAPKSIVVAGLGNIGSHLIRSLARLPGLNNVVLVDKDSYESRNALNQDIEPRQDIGKGKAVVQARRLLEMRPSLRVSAFHAPLESLPLGVWRADLILACLDSRNARQQLNERAWRMGSNWIDSGVLGSECLARVNIYTPAVDAPCLECAWSDEDYQTLDQQYPCGGQGNRPVPNDASAELGALAAAMLAMECRKMLAGELDHAAIGRQVTLNARWHRLAVTSFRRNPRCRFDHASWRIEPLRCRVQGLRIADLLEMAGTVSVPGQRFIRRLVCFACGNEKQLFHLDSSLLEERRLCERCRQPMKAPGFDIVENLGRELPVDVRNRTLDQAGLRYGDVIHAGDRYLEIAASVAMESEL